MRELPCPATSGSFAAVPEIEPASADSRSCTLTAKATFSQFNFSLPSSTLGPSLEGKTKPSQTVRPAPSLPWLNGTATNMPKHSHGTSPLAATSERKVKGSRIRVLPSSTFHGNLEKQPITNKASVPTPLQLAIYRLGTPGGSLGRRREVALSSCRCLF